jgi:hypothetical protein
MSGHFENGAWKEDIVPIIVGVSFHYSSTDQQLFTITEKLAWIERELMEMKSDIQSIKCDMRFKQQETKDG